MYIIDALNRLIKNKPDLFTTPGHAQGAFIPENLEKLIGKNIFRADYSEVIGLDNLQDPQDVILKSQQWASEIYDSKQSFYLVNGSSSGVLSLMMVTLCPFDKVLISRNAHKSVINSLVLTGAAPVWINTDWNETWNIPDKIDVAKLEKILKSDKKIKAFWLTNPTYEGIVSDVESISEVCKKYDVLLIVDEAHGALWNFSESLPAPAIKLGADASVQSLHKTGLVLNQGAILHISKNSKIDTDKVQQCINMVTTTSPSFPILASIEASIEYLSSKGGSQKIDDLLNNIQNFKDNLEKDIKNIKFLENGDKTKIFFGIDGISGIEIAEKLENVYNIELELDNDRGLLAITGAGTTGEKLNRLSTALKEISKDFKSFKSSDLKFSFSEPEMKFTPREAFYKKSRKIKLQESKGKVSKETVVKYPPGIPVLISGEVITQEHINLIEDKEFIEIID